MTDYTGPAAKVLQDQPFSRHLGAELISATAEGVQISLPLGDRLKQQHGFAHGGAISYLADNAITFAGGIALGGDVLTLEFKINYLRPGVGERLIARATLKSAGRRQAVCACDIFAEDESGDRKLCATAMGTVLSRE